MAKMRGISTHGAPATISSRSGVVACLKSITPSAIGMPCAAHRLNLALSHAEYAVPYITKFCSILRQLYHFFDSSVNQMAKLEAVHI